MASTSAVKPIPPPHSQPSNRNHAGEHGGGDHEAPVGSHPRPGGQGAGAHRHQDLVIYRCVESPPDILGLGQCLAMVSVDRQPVLQDVPLAVSQPLRPPQYEIGGRLQRFERAQGRE